VIGILDWLVGGLLAAWFVVTAIASVPSLRRRLRRHDVVNLIPDWALFAKPRTVDMTLLRRDVLRDGTLTSWREVEIAGGRHWYNFIWHPELGPRRAFLALADQMARTASRQPNPRWRLPGQGTPSAIGDMTTVPYLAILKYVSARSHPSVEATQFMVMAVAGQAITGRYDSTEPGDIEFVSELHLVPSEGQPVESDPHELAATRLTI
jgi:hypothetical protein